MFLWRILPCFWVLGLVVNCSTMDHPLDRTIREHCSVPVAARSDCVRTGQMMSPGKWEPVREDSELLQSISAAIRIPLPNQSSPIFNWEWVPSCSPCKSRTMDRKMACRALRHTRRLFLVGDSVQGQWAAGMNAFLGGSAQSLSSNCLLYTSPSPRDLSTSRMPSSA